MTVPGDNQGGNQSTGDASPAVEGARELAELAELAANAPRGMTIDVRIDGAGEMHEEIPDDPANPKSGGGPYCMAHTGGAADSPCQRKPHGGIDGRHFHPNLGWW